MNGNVAPGMLFITDSVHNRVELFRLDAPCRIFLELLESYRETYGLRIQAYVLMPDHYHLLIRFPDSCNHRDFLRDFKSLAGKNILVWLRERNFTNLLARFLLGPQPSRRKDPQFSVLQYGCYKNTF